ncbi:MAG TPA: carbonic anhydrase [Polyangiaceae bacterium]
MLVLVPLLGAALGCNKLVGDAHATEPVHSPPKHDAKATPSGSAKSEEHAPAASGASRFVMPFAWEVSKDEPLAKSRAYLGDLFLDNDRFASRGAAHFAPLAKGQSPRATVVTCSDSRVQSDAWDATAENDDFTIRNIGNQVNNAHGSVEYGLEHLHTPVLFILGHTGCGAVKAAMGKRDGLSAPIRAELGAMKLPEPAKGSDEKKAWAEGVVANVNLQVGFALSQFGKLVTEGNVVVVGAVYDLTNDLGRGHGRIHVVNVNGNTEAERLKAFDSALRARSQSRTDGASEAELAVMDRVKELTGGRHAEPHPVAGH